MKNLSKSNPIGIFDSGIGGLTVADAVRKKLPGEQIIYFGDTAHLPYGEKSPEALKHYSEVITQYLIDKSCKMVIVACNTASSVAFEHLNAEFEDQVLLLNVIDPVVEKIVSQDDINRVGVIGTKATIRSNAYEQKLHEKKGSLKVSSLATPLLVSMIEEGFFDNKISHTIIEAYLNYPDFKFIDAMILGCTHFPLIKKEIAEFFEGQIRIYDSTEVVANACARMLLEKDLRNDQEQDDHHFMVSDYTHSFEQTTRIFFREKVKLEHLPLWDEPESMQNFID